MKESRFKLTGEDIGILSFASVAQAVDLGTTLYWFHNVPNGENNPISREVLNHGGDVGFTLFKLSATLIIAGGYLLVKWGDKSLGLENRLVSFKHVACALNLFAVAIDVNNLAIIVSHLSS